MSDAGQADAVAWAGRYAADRRSGLLALALTPAGRAPDDALHDLQLLAEHEVPVVVALEVALLDAPPPGTDAGRVDVTDAAPGVTDPVTALLRHATRPSVACVVLAASALDDEVQPGWRDVVPRLLEANVVVVVVPDRGTRRGGVAAGTEPTYLVEFDGGPVTGTALAWTIDEAALTRGRIHTAVAPHADITAVEEELERYARAGIELTPLGAGSDPAFAGNAGTSGTTAPGEARLHTIAVVAVDDRSGPLDVTSGRWWPDHVHAIVPAFVADLVPVS